MGTMWSFVVEPRHTVREFGPHTGKSSEKEPMKGLYSLKMMGLLFITFPSFPENPFIFPKTEFTTWDWL